MTASTALFRASFAAYLVEAACDLTLPVLSYALLRPVDRYLSLLAAFFGLLSTATFASAEIFYYAASLPVLDVDVERALSPDSKDSRLTQLTVICLALPESIRKDQGSHAAFTVRRKTFTYFLNNHHGNGIVSVCAKALPVENNVLVAAHPRKFYLPAYIGSRGWLGLRLDRGKIDWQEVRDLLTASYLQVAPRRLASEVEAEMQ